MARLPAQSHACQRSPARSPKNTRCASTHAASAAPGNMPSHSRLRVLRFAASNNKCASHTSAQ